MLDFDLSRLNVHSPYTVWQDGEYLLFKTDYDVIYTISFDVEDTISVGYWFNLYNRKKAASPNDKKLRDTVICVIEEFFQSNPGVLLYMCDTADERQAMRARLFLRWFNSSGKAKDYVIKTAMLTDEGQENYVAMIVKRNNKNLASILSYFDSQIELFESHK